MKPVVSVAASTELRCKWCNGFYYPLLGCYDQRLGGCRDCLEDTELAAEYVGRYNRGGFR